MMATWLAKKWGLSPVKGPRFGALLCSAHWAGTVPIYLRERQAKRLNGDSPHLKAVTADRHCHLLIGRGQSPFKRGAAQ